MTVSRYWARERSTKCRGLLIICNLNYHNFIFLLLCSLIFVIDISFISHEVKGSFILFIYCWVSTLIFWKMFVFFTELFEILIEQSEMPVAVWPLGEGEALLISILGIVMFPFFLISFSLTSYLQKIKNKMSVILLVFSNCRIFMPYLVDDRLQRIFIFEMNMYEYLVYISFPDVNLVKTCQITNISWFLFQK